MDLSEHLLRTLFLESCLTLEFEGLGEVNVIFEVRLCLLNHWRTVLTSLPRFTIVIENQDWNLGRRDVERFRWSSLNSRGEIDNSISLEFRILLIPFVILVIFLDELFSYDDRRLARGKGIWEVKNRQILVGTGRDKRSQFYRIHCTCSGECCVKVAFWTIMVLFFDGGSYRLIISFLFYLYSLHYLSRGPRPG